MFPWRDLVYEAGNVRVGCWRLWVENTSDSSAAAGS